MNWSKPDFVEISLCMEVTAYVNTDASVANGLSSVAGEPATAAFLATDHGQPNTDN